jgi:hypothetical protein
VKRLALVVLLFLSSTVALAGNWVYLDTTDKGEALMIDLGSLRYQEGLMMGAFRLGSQPMITAGLAANECNNDLQLLYVDFKPGDKNYPVKEVPIKRDGVRMYEVAGRALCKAASKYV